MIELTEDNLQQYINDNEKVIVQFGATWCGGCRVMKPKFKRMAAENESIVFIYADAEKFIESRGVATIKNLPTFVGFSNGELVAKEVGTKSGVLESLLTDTNNG